MSSALVEKQNHQRGKHMGEKWVCKNRHQFDMFIKFIDGWDWNKPLVLSWSSVIGRSNGQNNLMHRWFRDICAEMQKRKPDIADAVTEESVKVYFKKMFGVRTRGIDLKTLTVMTIMKSTSDYNQKEMYEFLRHIEVWCAEEGIMLPIWGEYEELLKEQRSKGKLK